MQPYQSYYQPYQNQYQQSLQNQIQNLQNQQAQYQAMLNQQQASQAFNVPTQIVSDFSSVQVSSVPMDANGALFIKNDRSEIQAKFWTADGKLTTMSYLPKIENSDDSIRADENLQNQSFNEFTEAFNEKINKMFDRLDIIEDLINTPRSKRTAKKEVDDNE